MSDANNYEDSRKQRIVSLIPNYFALAFSLTRNAADAEEILQDVAIYYWTRPDIRFETESEGFIEKTIAEKVKYAVIDWQRKRQTLKRCRETLLSDLTGDDEAIADLVASVPDSGTHPPGDCKPVVRSLLGNILVKLPDEQRTVLALHYFEGLSLEAISKLTGACINTVKSRILLGLKKMAASISMSSPAIKMAFVDFISGSRN
jgi:RNA polymerase sigma factor (sigma-70 family)